MCTAQWDGGVAKQLSDRYKDLEKEYYLFCQINNYDYNKLKSEVFNAYIDNKTICNMFSQIPDSTTDYRGNGKSTNNSERYGKRLKANGMYAL